MKHTYFIEKTIELAYENIQKGGGPFAAIVVNEQGEIVGVGQNSVTLHNDPTAHAEVQAIREACQTLSSFQLTNCTLYSSCEPCPMCLGAIYWARPKDVYFAATKHDAAQVGFDDSFIYEEIEKTQEKRSIPFYKWETKIATKPFDTWACTTTKIDY